MENRGIENERLARLEERLDEYAKKIAKLESSNELLYKMSVLLEVQTDLNKEQQRQMRENTKTLSQVNESLVKTNLIIEKMSERFDALEKRVDGHDDKIEVAEDKNTIDLRDSRKEYAKWLQNIPIVVGSAILAYALAKFGL